ncbi:MAG: DnaJ domain-containing protein [Bryobacteraceae bacterium]
MDDFVDYYELMQISQNAELPTIQRVYRMQAARYHPDNPETGDTDKFVLLQEAFAVLSDPDKRAAYDAQCSQERNRPMPVFETKEFLVGVDAEVNRRLGVLCLLYNRRREAFDHPTLSLLEMEARMSMPREHLEFTIWYLRSKGYVVRDESTSEISITSEGVDFVESSTGSNKIVYKLLTAAERGDPHPGKPPEENL